MIRSIKEWYLVWKLRSAVRHGRMTVWDAADRFAKKGLDKSMDVVATRKRLGTVRRKEYNIQYGVGKAKYLLNYHDGISGYRDGSPFFFSEIITNRKELDSRVKELETQGYLRS